MTAKKGSSAAGGTGHASAPLMRAALLRSLQREGKGVKSRQRLQMVADALVEAAINGEMAALREVFHRVDGKISDAASSGEGSGPVDLEIRWPTKAEKTQAGTTTPERADSAEP